MIEINIGAIIESEGREIGRVERVVLDRDSYEATQLVVSYGGPLHGREVLMPIGWVVATKHDRVRIAHTKAELETLPDFELRHYVQVDELEQEEKDHPRFKIRPADWVNYFVPLVANAFGDPFHTPGVLVTDQMLKASESALRRGLVVESSDGHKVGTVHEVLLSEPEHCLTSVVIDRGFLLTHPLKIPADWISRIEPERIVLNRTKRQVTDWEREQKR